MNRITTLSAIAIIGLCWAPVSHAAIRTIALTGQSAPGLTAGTNFSSFSFPMLNELGQVALPAKLTGADTTTGNDDGIWLADSNSLTFLAREGDQAPGLASGVLLGSLGGALLTDSGRIGFSNTLSGVGVTTANDQSLWSTRSGSLALAWREGDPAPGLPSGVKMGGIFSGPTMNNAGRFAFHSSVTGTGVTSANSNTIWAENASGFSLVARTGNQAPGTAAGANFNSFDQPATRPINDLGQTTSIGFFTGDLTSHVGVWAGGPGTFALVAKEGDPAPGTSNGVLFSGFNYGPSLNGAGQGAFGAGLTGTGVSLSNNIGIWQSGPAGLTMIVRTGSQAPGTIGGVNFKDVYAPAINDSGQIKFTGSLS
jgi:hypothetical protein